MTKYPEESRPVHVKLHSQLFNSISGRLGHTINYRKLKPSPKLLLKQFINTYVDEKKIPLLEEF